MCRYGRMSRPSQPGCACEREETEAWDTDMDTLQYRHFALCRPQLDAAAMSMAYKTRRFLFLSDPLSSSSSASGRNAQSETNVCAVLPAELEKELC